MKPPVNASGSIVGFIGKVQSANNRKSKDITLSIQEAIDLSASISVLLSKQNSLLEDIIRLQQQIIAGPIQIEMDGGSFD